DDIIKAKILRKKETLEFDVPLKSLFNTKSQVERIPWKAFGMQPYIVQHGIVFVELSHSYLVERLGKNWRSKALELAYLYDTKKYYQNEKENDKIVLISEVLPDPINIGYQNILLKPVVKVNQKKLMNLKHLYEEIQMAKQSRKNILELELSDYKKIYIDLSKEKEHQDILIKFNIPQDHYIF
ncbi:MAG: PDZ domain-containing protein, partial [Leptonema sp. (in: bacteria)]